MKHGFTNLLCFYIGQSNGGIISNIAIINNKFSCLMSLAIWLLWYYSNNTGCHFQWCNSFLLKSLFDYKVCAIHLKLASLFLIIKRENISYPWEVSFLLHYLVEHVIQLHILQVQRSQTGHGEDSLSIRLWCWGTQLLFFVTKILNLWIITQFLNISECKVMLQINK